MFKKPPIWLKIIAGLWLILPFVLLHFQGYFPRGDRGLYWAMLIASSLISIPATYIIRDWFASLRLTVVLLTLSLILIFVGTLAQVEQGIWVVVQTYFRSIFVWVELDLFRALIYPGSETHWLGGFPFPGGFLLLGLLVVNLIAAHAVRYKVIARGQPLVVGIALSLVAAGLLAISVAVPSVSRAIQQDVMLMLAVWAIPMALAAIGCHLLFGARKSGIVLIHVGLILMLLGEFVTGLAAAEGKMFIPEKGSANFIVDDREPELAFVTRTDEDPDTLRHVVISRDQFRSALQSREPIRSEHLPVAVRVEAYMPNSSIFLRPIQDGEQVPAKEQIAGRAIDIEPAEVVSGTQMNAADRQSIVITLLDGDRAVGRHKLSIDPVLGPRTVELAGRDYELSLRYKRTYLPYSIQLHDFTNDRFTGTEIARNYASELRLVENEGNERDTKIKMNQPLRYDGKAFFQAGFFQPPLPRNTGTILQVVENPGSWIPYMSCVIVTVGLCVQFGASLMRYGRRTAVKGVGN